MTFFDLPTGKTRSLPEPSLPLSYGRFDTKLFRYKSFRYKSKSFRYTCKVDSIQTEVNSIQPLFT